MVELHPFYNPKWTAAVVLDEDTIRKVWAALELLGTPQCQVTYQKLGLYFTDLDGLLKCENNDQDPVVRMQFELVSQPDALVKVDFGPNERAVPRPLNPFDVVSVTCRGDRIREVAGKIEAALNDAKPWYSWLTRIPFLKAATPVAVLVTAVVLLSKLDQNRTVTVGDALLGMLTFFGSYVVSLGLLSALSERWTKLYPPVAFAFGNGATRHKNREVWNRWVLGGIVGVMVALLVTSPLKSLIWG